MVDDVLTREVKKAEFKVGDIVAVENTAHHTSDNVKEYKDGTIPYVVRATTNNGIKYMTKENPSHSYTDGDCLTFGAETGAFFYQRPGKLVTGVKVYRIPRGDIPLHALFYLSSTLQKISAKYGWSAPLTGEKLAGETITLPVAEDGTPDWDYMNDYMIAIQKKHLDQVEAYNKRQELILKKAHPELDTQGGLEEPEGGLREFIVGEVFNLTSTNSGIDKNKILYGDKNLVPYVTRSEFNNGVAMMIPKKQNAKYEVNGGNCVAIGLDTQTATYQETEFHTGQNVHVLRHPKMGKTNAQYIIANIKKVMQKFNWGGNGATLGRLSKESITLPATKDGTPDWDYMEQYMNRILNAQRESQRLHHRKEEAILRKLVSSREN